LRVFSKENEPAIHRREYEGAKALPVKSKLVREKLHQHEQRNAIAPVTMNGLAMAGIFGAARQNTDAPRTTVTMNADPQAIFTSGARSIERKVPSATAAGLLGHHGRRSSSKDLPPLAGEADAAVAGVTMGALAWPRFAW